MRRSLLRLVVVVSSLLWLSGASFPDALCILPHWPSC